MDFRIAIVFSFSAVMLSMLAVAVFSHERFLTLVADVNLMIKLLDQVLDLTLNVHLPIVIKNFEAVVLIITSDQSIAAAYCIVGLIGACIYPTEFMRAFQEACVPVREAVKTFWNAVTVVGERIYIAFSVKLIFEMAIFVVMISSLPDIVKGVVAKISTLIKIV